MARNFAQRYDLYGEIDPRSVAVAAQKGTLYRLLSPSGNSIILIKEDDGLTTNWISISLNRYTSGVGDTYDLESYLNWVNGSQTEFNGTNKWDNIANTAFPNWINLKLVYANVYGNTIPDTLSGQQAYVDSTNIYFIDYGYGLSEGNYTDFLNTIFTTYYLKTQLYSTDAYKWIASYNKLDEFYFIFEETGFIDDGTGGNLLFPCWYTIASNGPTMSDGIALNLVQASPYYLIPSGNLRNWAIL